jgi:hypothetical protein
LESLVNRVEYIVKFPSGFFKGDDSALQSKLESFLEEKELVIEKVKKKGTPAQKTVKIDLRPLILFANWKQTESGLGLHWTLRFGPGKNAKPERIAQLLMGLTEEEVLQLKVERKAFWIEKPDGTLTEP